MRDEDGGNAGHRHERLTQLILEEIESLIATEVSDPHLQSVRVSSVLLSVDYRSARVLYITTDEREKDRKTLDQIERAFERASPFMRRRVGEALDLKRLPELHFVYDRDAAAQLRARDVLEPKK